MAGIDAGLTGARARRKKGEPIEPPPCERTPLPPPRRRRPLAPGGGGAPTAPGLQQGSNRRFRSSTFLASKRRVQYGYGLQSPGSRWIGDEDGLR